MTPEQQDARDCLADGGKLSDPRYSQFPEAHEAKLKARCKSCWHLRQWFPKWVADYVTGWSKAANDPGAKRLAGARDDSGAIPESAQGRGVA